MTTKELIDLAFSRGYDRGNYSSAYETTDCETAVEKNPTPAEMQSVEEKEAFAHGFLLGFWSSFELHEIGDPFFREAVEAAIAWCKEKGIDDNRDS